MLTTPTSPATRDLGLNRTSNGTWDDTQARSSDDGKHDERSTHPQVSEWMQNEVEEDGPACQACRKRKRKCTRSQPCYHCAKLGIDCSYEDTRAKPGIKPGVIEALTQRIVNLERMFLGQCMLNRQFGQPLRGRVTDDDEESNVRQEDTSLENYVDNLKENLLNAWSTIAQEEVVGDLNLMPERASKKRKKESGTSTGSDEQSRETTNSRRPVAETRSFSTDTDSGKKEHNITADCRTDSSLPPDDMLYDLIDLYFTIVHPWIPILHETTFFRKVRDPEQRTALDTVLHAIVVATMRFSSDSRLKDLQREPDIIKTCRQHVIMSSMETFSVENLQALVIIAFDTIGSGKGPKSWAIVDSMTRTVEHLQLSFEDSDEDDGSINDGTWFRSLESTKVDEAGRYRRRNAGNKLIRRMAFLKRPKNWTESEERRRVFWNVFLLDRFCSVSTGWNPSITSVDMRRRLPCEGTLWEAETAVRTRYLSMGDTSQEAGKGVRTDFSSTSLIRSPARPFVNDPNSYMSEANKYQEETASLGAFAYCIEATEFLSQITQFFLQQAVNPDNIDHLTQWLLRFKELDLQLVQWKCNLPAQWREATVRETVPKMDPNLTLAHITHNTSVILLHQFMAYPTASWQSNVMRSSQLASADTCVCAAREISTITQKYLAHNSGITNPQFAFCLFVAGRALLARTSFYNVELLPEFHDIVRSLLDLSRRWHGNADLVLDGNQCPDDLARRFARNLHHARAQAGLKSNAMDIQQPVYSIGSEQDSGSVTGHHTPRGSAADMAVSCTAVSNLTEVLSSASSDQASRAQLENQDLYDYGSISFEPSYSLEPLSLASPPLPLSFRGTEKSFYNGVLQQTDGMSVTGHSSFYASVSGTMGKCYGSSDSEAQRFRPAESATAFSAKEMEDISNLLTDPSFLELDRVLIFGDNRAVREPAV